MRCKCCDVCREAQANPGSKNRRLNPSLLVRHLETIASVLVDCGKTFRETALRIIPKIGVSAVHSMVLTHNHADACLGMDDLREVQPVVEILDPIANEVCKIPPESMKVHCCEDTSRGDIAKFPYLMENTTEAQPRHIFVGRPNFDWKFLSHDNHSTLVAWSFFPFQ
ncbi:hypothetical protein PRIC1_013391 [Phytophthora ramorum]